MSLLAYCLSAFCGQRAGAGCSGVESSESPAFADPINRAWPTQLNSPTSLVAFAFPFNHRPIVVCVGVGLNVYAPECVSVCALHARLVCASVYVLALFSQPPLTHFPVSAVACIMQHQ